MRTTLSDGVQIDSPLITFEIMAAEPCGGESISYTTYVNSYEFALGVESWSTFEI